MHKNELHCISLFCAMLYHSHLLLYSTNDTIPYFILHHKKEENILNRKKNNILYKRSAFFQPSRGFTDATVAVSGHHQISSAILPQHLLHHAQLHHAAASAKFVLARHASKKATTTSKTPARPCASFSSFARTEGSNFFNYECCDKHFSEIDLHHTCR